MQTPAETTTETITMYSTSWCPDCHRAKRFLTERGIAYTEVNIERTPGAAELVMKWANGKRVVPTIAVGEQILVNPKMSDLALAIGITY